MKLSDVFADYLQYLTVEKGCTKRTVQCYSSWSNHFQKWLVENGNESPTLADFNTLTLKRYLYHISKRGIRPRTVRAAFYPLKGLGVYLKGLNAIETDPCQPITLPKLDAARREMVSDA
ncbi:MAG: site-specific integrase [Akkermansiaceae bacterium]|nr:site-specific integrase [Armatimonadota bacterium]